VDLCVSMSVCLCVCVWEEGATMLAWEGRRESPKFTLVSRQTVES
jgi:hypothetical protein